MTTNPFLTIDPEGHTVPDAVAAWGAINPWDNIETCFKAGDQLATELDRTRAMVASLEAQLSCVYNHHHCPDHKVIGKEHVECDRCGHVTWLPE